MTTKIHQQCENCKKICKQDITVKFGYHGKQRCFHYEPISLPESHKGTSKPLSTAEPTNTPPHKEMGEM